MNSVSNISACASRMQEIGNHRIPFAKRQPDQRRPREHKNSLESLGTKVPRRSDRFPDDAFPPVPVNRPFKRAGFYRKTERVGKIAGHRTPIQAQKTMFGPESAAQDECDILPAQCSSPKPRHTLRCKAFPAFLHPALQHLSAGCGSRTDQKTMRRAPFSLAWLVCY